MIFVTLFNGKSRLREIVFLCDVLHERVRNPTVHNADRRLIPAKNFVRKCGFEQGFKIIIPAYANSTYDNPYFDKETSYKYFNEFMWPKRYAKAVSVEEAIEMMKYTAKKL